MIIPDINLLVYTYNKDAPYHTPAVEWWQDLMNGRQTIGLPWIVCLGFLRLMTSLKILKRPMESGLALSHVRSWILRPQVQILQPGPRHLDILESFAQKRLLSSALVTDAHLAALAIEYQAEIHSNDGDFDRFPGLRRGNPLGQSFP